MTLPADRLGGLEACGRGYPCLRVLGSAAEHSNTNYNTPAMTTPPPYLCHRHHTPLLYYRHYLCYRRSLSEKGLRSFFFPPTARKETRTDHLSRRLGPPEPEPTPTADHSTKLDDDQQQQCHPCRNARLPLSARQREHNTDPSSRKVASRTSAATATAAEPLSAVACLPAA